MLAALVLSVTRRRRRPGRPRPPPRRPAPPRRPRRGGARRARRRRGLMRAAANRLDGLDEEPVLVLATHLETPERVRALYLVSLALGDLESVERDRLDDLLGAGPRACSISPTSPAAGPGPIVESRRTTRSGSRRRTTVADRIRTAPRCVPARQRARGRGAPGRVARPAAAARRATVHDGSPRRATTAASRSSTQDRPGLIAAVTGVLADAPHRHRRRLGGRHGRTAPSSSRTRCGRRPRSAPRSARPATSTPRSVGAFVNHRRPTACRTSRSTTTTTRHPGTRCARSAARIAPACCTRSRSDSPTPVSRCTRHASRRSAAWPSTTSSSATSTAASSTQTRSAPARDAIWTGSAPVGGRRGRFGRRKAATASTEVN